MKMRPLPTKSFVAGFAPQKSQHSPKAASPVDASPGAESSASALGLFFFFPFGEKLFIVA